MLSCGSFTLANGPAAADKPGYCCIGLKTEHAMTGIEHGSLKRNKKKQLTVHTPAVARSCAVKTCHHSCVVFDVTALPSIQTNGRPQAWMLREFAGKRPLDRGQGSEPSDAGSHGHEQRRFHCRHET